MPGRRRGVGTREEWFQYGERDLRGAKFLSGDVGATGIVAVLIQQAVEKYLKGYLIGRGWKLKKTHDVEVLMSEAATHDKSFEQFLDFARALSAYYVRERYPPGPAVDYPREEIADMLEQAEKLIARIKEAMR